MTPKQIPVVMPEYKRAIRIDFDSFERHSVFELIGGYFGFIVAEPIAILERKQFLCRIITNSLIPHVLRLPERVRCFQRFLQISRLFCREAQRNWGAVPDSVGSKPIE